MSNKNKQKKHHNKKHDVEGGKKVTVDDFEHISIFNSPLLSSRVLLSSA
jgi:hypothetical protein